MSKLGLIERKLSLVRFVLDCDDEELLNELFLVLEK